MHLRDGNREIDISGSPGFVRQILDDLPALLARLRGEPPPTPSSIRIPARPSGPAAQPEMEPTAVAVPVSEPTSPPPTQTGTSLEGSIFTVLRSAGRPLAISAIRERLDAAASGQQVRRILERAGSRVVASGDRPIRYRLRG